MGKHAPQKPLRPYYTSAFVQQDVGGFHIAREDAALMGMIERGLVGFINCRHTAAADRLDQLILSEGFAAEVCHDA